MADLITIPTIEDISRRTFITGAMASAFLIACGDSEDEDAAPEATTRVVDTELGPVEVPVKPQRVVVFDRRGTLGYLLDLGIKPIAAMSAPAIYGGSTFHPLLGDDAANIATISATEPDIEQLVSLQPDLIVGFSTDVGRVKENLQAIAPTISVPIDFNNPEDELLLLGRVFGMEEKAQKLVAEFDAEVESIGKKLKTSPGSVSIVLPQANDVRLYSGTNLAGQIVTKLGGSVVPDLAPLKPDATGNLAVISYEQVSVITGDTIIFLSNLGSDWVTYKTKLTSMPVFQSLPAVKANRIIEIESQANFGTAGLRGQRQILDVLAKAFA